MLEDMRRLTTSDYVPGNMYPLNWTCIICGHNASLVWDLARGNCHCASCKAPYTFYPDGYDGDLADHPVSRVVEAYIEACRLLWQSNDYDSFWDIDGEDVLKKAVELEVEASGLTETT